MSNLIKSSFVKLRLALGTHIYIFVYIYYIYTWASAIGICKYCICANIFDWVIQKIGGSLGSNLRLLCTFESLHLNLKFKSWFIFNSHYVRDNIEDFKGEHIHFLDEKVISKTLSIKEY